MNFKVTPLWKKYSYIILNKWLLLAILGVFLFSNSCSTSRSVRYSDKYSKNFFKNSTKSGLYSKEQNSSGNLDQNELIDEFQSKGSVKGSNKNGEKIDEDLAESTFLPDENKSTNDNAKRKIPTLREQMQLFADEQSQIKSKVTTLEGDLKEIKNSLDDIKNAILVMNGSKELKAYAGEPPQNQNTVQPKHTSAKKAETIILSDEKVLKIDSKPKKIKEKAQAIPSDENAKPKKKIDPSPKPTPVKSNSVIENTGKEPQKSVTEIKYNNPDYVQAMDNISRKEFGSAIDKLRRIVITEKNQTIVGDCHYWIGESNFGLKEYQQAIIFFSKVIRNKSSNKHDKAQAMIAESNIRIGNVEEAKQAYQSLIDNYPGSTFVPKARKMLQQL